MAARAFELKVKRTLLARSMLTPGQKIVVGVSGGPDSTALLLAMESLSEHYDYGWELHIAHVHHHLRGADADEDLSYVSQLAEKREKPEMFHVEHFDVAEKAKLEKISLELAGRLCRYEVYEGIATRIGAKAVAVGHTADDNVETVLQRIIRGTGLRGLGGIPPRRPIREGSEVFVIRPLIDCSRGEVEEYLQARGVKARIDASNLSLDYARNRIRNELLPLLESGYNRRVRQAVLRLARIASAADKFIQSEALDHVGGEPSVSVPDLRGEPEAVQLAALRQAIENAGLSAYLDRIEEALELVRSDNPSATLHLPNDLELSRSYDRIEVRRRREPEPAPEPVELPVPGEASFGNYLLRAEVISGTDFSLSQFKKSKGPLEEAMDCGVAGHTLLVRSRLPGDRFRLLGLPGEKKLKELLIDRKVPREEREALPLVVSSGRIVCVIGIGIDDRVKIRSETERVAVISATRRTSHEE